MALLASFARCRQKNRSFNSIIGEIRGEPEDELICLLTKLRDSNKMDSVEVEQKGSDENENSRIEENVDVAEPEATNEIAKKIDPINKETVHQICSGQVVLNLASAVKELLENSLDAGATSIEIRLREYGSELIEVIDNGCGVEEDNFQALTLKHHTSKIQDFSDLTSVSTFGFRGEALSSLCALGKVSIVTRHVTASYGYRIDYDSNGKIQQQVIQPRGIGTTVTVANIFSSLPVRRKEFIRNLKKEYAKLCNLLNAYVLISSGVKILCSNQPSKGARSVFLSSQASNTMRDNISCVFGHKQLSSLLPIQTMFPTETILEEYKLNGIDEDNNPFELTGFASSCAHGSGRSSQDRQFYYVNSRPCDLVKVAFLINDIYHQYNHNQYPFVVLNITVKNKELVDVNVTPDKRKLFITSESLMLATIKGSFLKMYENIPAIFQLHSISSSPLVSEKRGRKRLLKTPPKKTTALDSFLEKRVKIDENKVNDLSENSDNESNTVSEEETACAIKLERSVEFIVDVDEIETKKEFEVQDCLFHSHEDPEKTIDITEVKSKKAMKNLSLERLKSLKRIPSVKLSSDTRKSLSDKDLTQSFQSLVASSSRENRIEKNWDTEKDLVETFTSIITKPVEIYRSEESGNESEELKLTDETSEGSTVTLAAQESQELDTDKESRSIIELGNPESEEDLVFDEVCIPDRFLKDVKLTMEDIRDALENRASKYEYYEKLSKRDPLFTAEASDAINAEKELTREISKDMFEKMEIVGQFNLGFIIAKLDNDLFIIDQHATDEKYNFEQLEKNMIMERQKLISPMKLDLTVANKNLLIDHMAIFNKNGFFFDVKEDDDGKEIFLTDVPMSRNVIFGKDDIDEILFLLQEDSGSTTIRPSRVRSMLASRACRQSIMIGTALEMQDMRRIVNHMAELKQPWNCPHGRPTMRHLCNLRRVEYD